MSFYLRLGLMTKFIKTRIRKDPGSEGLKTLDTHKEVSLLRLVDCCMQMPANSSSTHLPQGTQAMRLWAIQ
jgi:hypothetical protein